MRTNTFFFRSISAVLILSLNLFISCREDPITIERESLPDTPIDVDSELTDEILTAMCVDVFAASCLSTYYLWIDDEGRKELINNVFTPDTCFHPKTSLKKVLHPDDRWTELHSDMSHVIESSDGVDTSFGVQATPMLISNNSDDVIIVIDFAYENSPAQEAGLKRGDIFTKINGKSITRYNYLDFFRPTKTSTLEYGLLTEKGEVINTGNTITLTPVKMYNEPVVKTDIYQVNQKKVGYLVFTSFNEDFSTLKSAFQYFTEEGISEIVLDLRYNGGGYITTLGAMSSMLAPHSAVENEELFIKQVYNKNYTNALNRLKIDTDGYFDKEYLSFNPGIKKIYALVSRNTASASEMLLVGLAPYLDITVIGEQTHGKFCSGMMLTAKSYFNLDGWQSGKEFYDKFKDYINDWGMYVMVGSITDKNGNNPARPNGIVPDFNLKDNRFDGCELGDENETLLRRALELAGKKYNSPARGETRALELGFEEIQMERHNYAIANKKGLF